MYKITIALLLLLNSNILFSQQPKYEVFNTSINSKYAELGVKYLNANEVIFASSKKNLDDKTFSRNRRKNNRHLFLEIYKAKITTNNNLQQVGKFTNEINNKVFENDITFSSNLKHVYFTWNNFYNTLSRKDSAKWRSLHVVKADLNEDLKIQNIRALPFNSDNYSIKNPVISPNGKQLYFVSDMPGGYGKSDIYVVDIYENNTYSNPRNLGPEINSSEVELFPFIDANNTLYFSSTRVGGFGDFDIYKSTCINGKFEKASLMPKPINSKYDDFGYVTYNNGKSGFISSNRKGGEGDADIYSFVGVAEKCTETINFVFIDKKNNQPVENVLINVYKNNSKINSLIITNANNTHLFECKAKYLLEFVKEGYDVLTSTIITENVSNLKEKNIVLNPTVCNIDIKGVVLNERNNAPVNNAQIKLFSENNDFVIATSNEEGFYNFTVDCNKKYKIVATHPNYNPKILYLSSNKTHNSELVQNIELEFNKCEQILTLQIKDKDSLDKVINTNLFITENNREIDTITFSNTTFKTTLNCNKTYSITAKAKNYKNATIEVKTTSNSNSITKNIFLTKEVCSQTVMGNIIDSTNQKLLQASVNLIQNSKIIDNKKVNGAYNFNLKCNANYEIKAVSSEFNNNSIAIKTDNVFGKILNRNIALSPQICNEFVLLEVVNKLTKEPIENAKISLQNRGVINEFLSNIKPSNLVLECNNNYSIKIEKSGFKTVEKSIKTRFVHNNTYSITIELTPKKCQQVVQIKPVDIYTNKIINTINIAVKNLKNTEITKIKTSLNNKVLLACNSNFEVLVSAPGYINKSFTIQTSNTPNKVFEKPLLLMPKAHFSIKNNTTYLKHQPLEFELDNADITKQIATELFKVVQFLKSYPKYKLEVKVHTDSRAPDNYNMALSNRRATSIINYLINQEIDSSRISGKGYGETQLLNKCSNGVNCSEEEHLVNRRVELILSE